MTAVLQLAKRASQSTFLLILCSLIVLDLFFSTVRPLRFAPESSFVPLDQNPVVAKLPDYLSGHNSSDVVMLGSSLILVPSYLCDKEMDGQLNNGVWQKMKGARINDLNAYTKARWMQRLLDQEVKKNWQVTNLGITGSMMSDHCLVFEKMISSGKRPRLILCGVAPRDFMDNQWAQLEKTPVYQVLADFTCIGDLFDRKLPFSETRDFIVGNIWYFYKVKADYKAITSALFATVTGHPMNLFLSVEVENQNAAKSAVALDSPGRKRDQIDKEQMPHAISSVAGSPGKLESAGAHQGGSSGKAVSSKTALETHGKPEIADSDLFPSYIIGKNTLTDLPLYKNRVYNPPNVPLFEREVKYYEKMLKLAQKNDVPLVIVNMPLTNENKDAINPKLRQRYNNVLADLSRQYNVKYFDMDGLGGFEFDDFQDSCHLNERGGKKFFTKLVSYLLSDKDLATRLNRPQ